MKIQNRNNIQNEDTKRIQYPNKDTKRIQYPNEDTKRIPVQYPK